MRTVLLELVLVLITATVASAECAWVFWERRSIVYSNDGKSWRGDPFGR